MGILITKKDDEQAYEALMDEINNIKINGTRKSLDELVKIGAGTKILSSTNLKENKDSDKKIPQKLHDLNLEKKLDLQLLYQWRYNVSKFEKSAESKILTDEEILKIVSQEYYSKNGLYDILPKKIVIKFGENILEALSTRSNFTIGKVVSIWYQADDSRYDRVKLDNLKTGEEKWFDTTQELPHKDKTVAVRLNNSWFNEYLYLD